MAADKSKKTIDPNADLIDLSSPADKKLVDLPESKPLEKPAESPVEQEVSRMVDKLEQKIEDVKPKKRTLSEAEQLLASAPKVPKGDIVDKSINKRKLEPAFGPEVNENPKPMKKKRSVSKAQRPMKPPAATPSAKQNNTAALAKQTEAVKQAQEAAKKQAEATKQAQEAARKQAEATKQSQEAARKQADAERARADQAEKAKVEAQKAAITAQREKAAAEQAKNQADQARQQAEKASLDQNKKLENTEQKVEELSAEITALKESQIDNTTSASSAVLEEKGRGALAPAGADQDSSSSASASEPEPSSSIAGDFVSAVKELFQDIANFLGIGSKKPTSEGIRPGTSVPTAQSPSGPPQTSYRAPSSESGRPPGMTTAIISAKTADPQKNWLNKQVIAAQTQSPLDNAAFAALYDKDLLSYSTMPVLNNEQKEELFQQYQTGVAQLSEQIPQSESASSQASSHDDDLEP